MAERKTLTFVLMDPPYEDARSTTALRLLDCAARRGHHIRVFAYEGAVALPFARQAPHPNPIHGHSVEEEDHPTPKEWVAAIFREAERNGGTVEWIQCGLCVDERGVADWVLGPRRGGPGDLVRFLESSDNALVIPAR